MNVSGTSDLGWGLLAPVFQPDEKRLVGAEGGLDAFIAHFLHYSRVLRVVALASLVDQHDGNAVNNNVCPLQTGVVQEVFVDKVKQRPFIFRASKYFEQFRAENL